MHKTDQKLERELIAGVLGDDESAFCELYALYKNRLIYFSMQFLKSHDAAKDVLQDAFLSVWQNRRFLNPDAPFAPYIYTIVRNRILNLLAGIDREQEMKKAILANALPVADDTDEALLSADMELLLEKAVAALTKQQRRVFEMSRKELKTHREIAAQLGISVYTVQQHISDALKVIRAYFTKYAR
ncbi:MAG: RNA polymerase sigma-70 factor [Tannerellaceae bacterium]|jgi:RNA polymerase sigma-70 factor (ECF subfamily)|nr:RNA polymerase sigma-70 factor [Tannerellaceae bacterium]